MSDEFYSNGWNSATPSGQVIPLPRPLYSNEAEQSVLGGLMLNNSAWSNVATRLGKLFTKLAVV